MKGAPLHTSDPVVTYCETITATSKEALSKSANKHNRLFCQAEPLNDEIQKMFDDEEIGPAMDIKERSKMLREHPAFGWDEASTPQKMFDDEEIGPTMDIKE